MLQLNRSGPVSRDSVQAGRQDRAEQGRTFPSVDHCWSESLQLCLCCVLLNITAVRRKRLYTPSDRVAPTTTRVHAPRQHCTSCGARLGGCKGRKHNSRVYRMLSEHAPGAQCSGGKKPAKSATAGSAVTLLPTTRQAVHADALALKFLKIYSLKV